MTPVEKIQIAHWLREYAEKFVNVKRHKIFEEKIRRLISAAEKLEKEAGIL